jgi:hypothetical protein
MPGADPHALLGCGQVRLGWLIGKAYRALPPDGAVICYDAVIDDDRRHNAFGLLMSLNMLIELADGFDYTGADCQQWLHEAGFRRTYAG